MDNGSVDYKAKYNELVETNRVLEERLEEVNKKLLKSEQLKSDFLSNIKNEINNPLTSIIGLLNQVILNPNDAKRVSTNARLIHSEAYTLNFQMKNIFHAAEIEAGQSYPQLSNVNINILISELVHSYQHQSEKKKIEFELVLNAEDMFATDREKVEMVLLNLLDNSIKFSNTDSKVIVSTDNNNEGLMISVKDFGVGIKQEDLGQIYDRFKQLDSGTRKEFGGHGLGLSIVHSLVDMLDGNVKIETEEGKGSEFHIFLPKKFIADDAFENDEILFDIDSEEKGETF